MVVLQLVSDTMEDKTVPTDTPDWDLYECETATSSGKRILKNAVRLYRQPTECSLG